MDVALDAIGELLDELAPRTTGSADEICQAFVCMIKERTAAELEQYAKAFEQLGAPGLAQMCQGLAMDKARVLH